MDEICIDRASSSKFKIAVNGSFSYSMREIKKQRKLLRTYKDRAFIMTILCKKSEAFYNTINTLFIIILILTSTILAISNSYHFQDNNINEHVRVVSIILNSINVLIVSFNSQLKIGQKTSEFKLKTLAFNNLSNEIEILFVNDTLDQTSFQNIITQYDIIADNTDTFPGFIKRYVSKKYRDDYNMPVTVISPHKRNSDSESNGTPPIQDIEEMYNIYGENNLNNVKIVKDEDIEVSSEPNRERINSNEFFYSPVNSI